MIMSLITANTAGSTKRTVVNAAFFVSYCAGNIIGPFAFISTEAPIYKSGIIAVLVAFCAEIALLLVYALWAARLNKIKERDAASAVEEESIRALVGLQDMTDKENPLFRYRY